LTFSTPRAALLGGALLLLSGSVRAQTSPAGADADSARAALERELADFAIELETDVRLDDPFADGSRPDLVLLSTAEVFGELAPCG
jgi:hypothetical protein